MRFRMEILEDDEHIIRNVETDVRLGTVIPYCTYDPHYPDRYKVSGCSVLNTEGRETAYIGNITAAMDKAAIAVASHQEHHGYPGLKGKRGRSQPDRVECLLGTLLADTTSQIARALIEYQKGGLTAETKSRVADLITQLYAILSASRFGSWNGERQTKEPYFAHSTPWEPRMSFGSAAKHYGMMELRTRFPDVDEATLQEMLSWPLKVLTCTAHGLMGWGEVEKWRVN